MNNRIELSVLKEAIEKALISIKDVIKELNHTQKVTSEEEAKRHCDTSLNPAIARYEDAVVSLNELIEGKDLSEQDYTREEKIDICAKMIFIDKKVDEIQDAIAWITE